MNENVPKNIAIIMDGNRRWAKERNLPIKKGHMEGSNNLKKITEYAKNIGIKSITVYAFSTENWNRSKEEVDDLMELLYNYTEDLLREKDFKDTKFLIFGSKEKISDKLLNNFEKVEEKTKSNTGITIGLCINYGGRDELIKAVKDISKSVKDGKIDVENIDEDTIKQNLYTKELEYPDLVIRTGGEQRISNFLIWQLAYSELYFTDVYWPDFDKEELKKAIDEYERRNRRYGK